MRGMARGSVWLVLGLGVLFAGEVQGQTCGSTKVATGGTCVSINHGASTVQSPTLISATKKAYFSFTSTTGTNSITFDRDTNVRVLVVGGGGSGACRFGGGGGAGAMIAGGYLLKSGTTYTINVGPGGASVSTAGIGNNGQDSNITYNDGTVKNLVLAKGGGAGGSGAGNDGGSGGGGSIGGAGGSAVSTNVPSYIYGNVGGKADGDNVGSCGQQYKCYIGAGGGGRGTAGGAATATSTAQVPGNGGDGITDDITGSAVTYAAGGGGGCHKDTTGSASVGGSAGQGPSGGNVGGAGTRGNSNAVAGAANTGSGGGGSGYDTNVGAGSSGKGGDGVVILQWDQCPSGYTGTNTNCVLCPAGSYIDGTGTCVSCGSGLWSAPGSSSSSACVGCAPVSGSQISSATATKGTEFTDVPGYRVHQYLATGGATTTVSGVTFSQDTVADVLVVGGGGAGGFNTGGGGGAGAVIYYSGYKFSAGTSYTFTVGAGGTAPTAGSTIVNGDDSSIKVSTTNIFLAKGGGGSNTYNGACSSSTGGSGASGGGGGTCSPPASGTSTSTGGATVNTNALSTINGYTLGNAGGNGYASSTGWTTLSSGGGGGAGTAGQAGGTSDLPGKGGNGIYQVPWSGQNLGLSSIFGSSYTNVAKLESDGYYYLAGGGGGSGNQASGFTTIKGGLGGGGDGLDKSTSATPTGCGGVTSGLVNTGSGGGGGCADGGGGNGGSGLILLRYSVCQPCGAGMRLQNAGAAGSCTACMSGTYSGPGQSACSSCPADSGSPVAADKCYANAGKYPKFVLTGTQSSEVVNLARSCGSDGKTACTATSSSTSSATDNAASFGNDAIITSGTTGFVMTNSELNPWWKVDFTVTKNVVGGKFWNRIQGAAGDRSRADGFKIWIGNDGTAYNGGTNVNCYTHTSFEQNSAPYSATFSCIGSGRYVYLHLPKTEYLNFNELEVYPLITSTVTSGQLLVINNDFVSDTFWGLSGSVSIVFPQWMHPSVLLGSPQIPPAISDNDYPVVTETTGKVVQPILWYKFDSANCKADSSGNGYTLGFSTAGSTGTEATCVSSFVKRGDNSANFVSGSKTNFIMDVNNAASLNLPGKQAATGISMVIWMRVSTSTPAWAYLIDFEVTTTFDSTRQSANVLIYRENANNDLTFYSGSVSYTKTGVIDNNWHFYVWSIATNGDWTISVDTTNSICPTCGTGNTKTQALTAATGSQKYTYRFASKFGGTDFSDFNLDDFRIYSSVLTTAQVTTLYQGRVGVYNATFGSCPDSGTSCVAGVNGSKHCDKFGGGVCCGAGKYLVDGSDSACQNCPAGTYSTDGAGTSCTVCAAGTSSPSGSISSANCTGCGSATCSTGYKRCVNSSASVCCGQSNAQEYFVEGTHTACQTCPSGLFGDGSGTTCLDQCPAGQYMDGQCKQCAAGKYRATPGAISATDCLNCTAGTNFASSQGSISCTSCSTVCPNPGPAGYYISTACTQSADIVCSQCTNKNQWGYVYTSQGTTSTNCQYNCAAGAYWTGSACAQCPPGTFQNFTTGFSGTSCQNCSAGTYMASSGASVCLACPLDATNTSGASQSQAGATVCRSSPGFYESGGNFLACANGTFSSTIGQSSCQACANGTVAGAPRMSSCTACAAGTFASGSGMSACLPCAAGTFANQTGVSACTNCSVGKYSTGLGMFSELNCTTCAAGKFSIVSGVTVCGNCTASCGTGQGKTVDCSASQDLQCGPCTNKDSDTYADAYTSGGTSTTNCAYNCKVGSYKSGSTCTQCGTGTYQDSNGFTGGSCTQCGTGKASTELGATTSGACVSCVPGKFQGSQGQAACVGCTAGTNFAANNGQTVCNSCNATACPSGQQVGIACNVTADRVCTACPTGKAGTGGTCGDCTTGKYSNTTGLTACYTCEQGKYQALTGQTECSLCSAGKYGTGTGFVSETSCTNCSVGSFSAALGATSNATCSNCPAGNFLSGQSCNPCLPGTFTASGGLSACSPCGKGTFLVESGKSVCSLCPAGTASNSTGMTSNATCARCPAGSYGPTTGLSACTTCEAGKFQTGTGMSGCDLCGNGTFSAATNATSNATCQYCAAGRYGPGMGLTVCPSCDYGQYQSGSGLSACVLCAAGTYNPSQASVSSASCIQCVGGKYQTGTGRTAETQCDVCGVGRYSTALGANASSTCANCSAGTVQPLTFAVNCTNCSAGTYQAAAGQGSCLQADKGYFVDAAARSSQSACSAGQFQNETGKTFCYNCSAGTYQAGTGFSSCTQASQGYFVASAGLSSQSACSAGQFQNETGKTFCYNCSAGTYQNGTGFSSCTQASLGYFVASAGQSAQSACGGGTYSYLQGMTFCSLCRAGTFQPLTAQTAVSACQNCGAGKYSAVEGLNQSSGCLLCSNATYSTVADLNSSSGCKGCPSNAGNQGGGVNLQSCVCNAGYSGANGGNCTLCNRTVYCMTGTANNCPQFSQALQTGASLITDCYCNAGYYGYALIAGNPCAYCPADSYCPGGAVNYTVACPYGQKAYGNSTSASACFCPPNAETGPGAYNENACTCKKGYKKVTNASSPLFGWSCQLCAQGEICVGGINSTCPQNSQPPASGQVNSYLDCTCMAGFYNTTVQNESVMCQPCPANSYCLGGGHIAGCPGASTQVSPPQSPSVAFCLCLNGTAGIGNVTCSPCSPGKYCILGQELNCPQNMNSPASSTVVRNCSCNAGYYGDNGGACLSCPAGKYNLIQGCYSCQSKLDTDCVLCSIGTYSTALARNTTCDLCGTGKYLDLTGQDAEVDCKLCSTGTYQTGSGMVAAGNCTACAAGYSQPLQGANGSSACLACGKGTYQENSGQAACVPCGAGTFSEAVNASNASTCASCGLGTWSAAQGAQNSSACQNCSAGTYQTGTGMQASAKCLACAAGAFGSAVGLTICSNCSAGRFTNATGMSFCYNCSAGKYGTGVGSAAEAGCLLCAAGTYGTAVGSTACTPCGAGTFSPNQGSAAANVCQLCRVGTFQTGTGMPASANCSLCDAGTFQTGSGMPASANCSQCGAGTFQTGLGMPASANCSLCGLGTYQTGSGMPASANCSLCAAGTFQTGSGMWASANCSQCGAGLYQTGSGMQASANCSQCVAGTFQTGSGMSAASDCSECGPGTYSVAKASSCKNCPSNSNSGSAATVCVVNAGFYNLGANQISFHPFNAENMLADVSGNGNTLTLDNNTVESTANGPWAGNDALVLNGSNYLKIPNLYIDESYTVCVWHKFTGLTDGLGNPADFSTYLPTSTFRTILKWNAFTYYARANINGVGIVQTLSNSLVSNILQNGVPLQGNVETWYHACYKGYKKELSAYYTGSPTVYSRTIMEDFKNGTMPVIIGSDLQSEPFRKWLGHLDDVRWFNKRINSDEYMAIYNSRDTYSNVLPVACPAGTYLTQAGATSISNCVLCGAGTFQTGTGMALASDCTACGAGTFQTGVGMTLASNCVQCGAGKVQNSTGAISESNCTNCTNGTFTASDKPQQCWPCPSNSTSPTSSDRCTCGGGFAGIILKSTDTCKQCTTCDPNAKTFGVCDFVTKFDNVSCACNAGYWGDGFVCQACKKCDGNAQQLATCPFNSTSDTAACGCQNGYFGDGLKCTACPQGTWGSGGTFCVPCGKGLYSDGLNQTSNATCLPCPKDTYAPREASGNQSAACLPCPQFSTTAGVGTKSRVECKCAPGYLNFITETGGDCSGCGINEYPSESQGSCLPCPANTASPAGSVGIWQCAANAGYFARYTRTLNMIVEVPEEDSDPLVVEAVMRAAAGGGDDVTVVVANVTLP